MPLRVAGVFMPLRVAGVFMPLRVAGYFRQKPFPPRGHPVSGTFLRAGVYGLRSS
jgi:hypothetical protein